MSKCDANLTTDDLTANYNNSACGSRQGRAKRKVYVWLYGIDYRGMPALDPV